MTDELKEVNFIITLEKSSSDVDFGITFQTTELPKSLTIVEPTNNNQSTDDDSSTVRRKSTHLIIQQTFIKTISPNSPASKAGLQPNDVLLEINGIDVRQSASTAIGRHLWNSANKIQLKIQRKVKTNLQRKGSAPSLLHDLIIEKSSEIKSKTIFKSVVNILSDDDDNADLKQQISTSVETSQSKSKESFLSRFGEFDVPLYQATVHFWGTAIFQLGSTCEKKTMNFQQAISHLLHSSKQQQSQQQQQQQQQQSSLTQMQLCRRSIRLKISSDNCVAEYSFNRIIFVSTFVDYSDFFCLVVQRKSTTTDGEMKCAPYSCQVFSVDIKKRYSLFGSSHLGPSFSPSPLSPTRSAENLVDKIHAHLRKFGFILPQEAPVGLKGLCTTFGNKVNLIKLRANQSSSSAASASFSSSTQPLFGFNNNKNLSDKVNLSAVSPTILLSTPPHSSSPPENNNSVVRRFPPPTSANSRDRQTTTIEESQIRWRDSFNQLLTDDNGVAQFSEFLKSLYCDENIKFWQAVNEFKNKGNDNTLHQRAQELYNYYLHPTNAKEQVNVTHCVLTKCTQQLNQPNINMFDLAQAEIYELMRSDCYPRFLKSKLLNRITISPNNSPKETFQSLGTGNKLKVARNPLMSSSMESLDRIGKSFTNNSTDDLRKTTGVCVLTLPNRSKVNIPINTTNGQTILLDELRRLNLFVCTLQFKLPTSRFGFTKDIRRNLPPATSLQFLATPMNELKGIHIQLSNMVLLKIICLIDEKYRDRTTTQVHEAIPIFIVRHAADSMLKQVLKILSSIVGVPAQNCGLIKMDTMDLVPQTTLLYNVANSTLCMMLLEHRKKRTLPAEALKQSGECQTQWKLLQQDIPPQDYDFTPQGVLIFTGRPFKKAIGNLYGSHAALTTAVNRPNSDLQTFMKKRCSSLAENNCGHDHNCADHHNETIIYYPSSVSSSVSSSVADVNSEWASTSSLVSNSQVANNPGIRVWPS